MALDIVRLAALIVSGIHLDTLLATKSPGSGKPALLSPVAARLEYATAMSSITGATRTKTTKN